MIETYVMLSWLPANSYTFKSLATFKSFVYNANLTNFVSLGF